MQIRQNSVNFYRGNSEILQAKFRNYMGVIQNRSGAENKILPNFPYKASMH